MRRKPVSSTVQFVGEIDFRYVYSLLALVLVSCLGMDESTAQSRKGFEVGTGPGLLVASDVGKSETGFGAHLTLANGIYERFTVGIHGAAGIIRDAEVNDDFTVFLIGAFGRLYFGSPEKLGRPYVTFGESQSVRDGNNGKATGPRWLIGAGFDYMRAGSNFGFYGEINYNSVSFEELSGGGLALDEFGVDVAYIVFAAGIRFRIR